jgi:hypothetical protein
MKLELPQLVEIYIALLTRLKTSTAQEAQQEGRIIYYLSLDTWDLPREGEESTRDTILYHLNYFSFVLSVPSRGK